MTSTLNSKRQNLPALQGLRALAFFGIFTEHTGLFQGGAWGVSIFFILSGFLMLYNYYDRPMESGLKKHLQFTWQKVGRLYLLHIITLIATIPFFIWTWGSLLTPLFFKTVTLNILLLHSWSANASTYFSFNAVSWYLSTCVLLYFCFPFIRKLILRYTKSYHGLLCIAITFIVQLTLAYLTNITQVPLSYSDNFNKWFTYVCPLFRLGDFFIGCNLGYLFIQRDNCSSKVSVTIKELFILCLTVLSLYIYNSQISLGAWEWSRYTLLYLPSSILLVYAVAENQGYFSKILCNKFFVHIGNISAYTFLIHPVIIRYVNRLSIIIRGYEPSPWLLSVITFVGTWIVSLLYVQIEKRMRKH